MRNRTIWTDHVISETGLFKILEQAGLANVYSVTPYGEVMQQGTMQDANHFNNIEDSLDAHEMAIDILMCGLRWLQEGETEEVRLDDVRLASQLILNGMRLDHWENEDRIDVHDTQIAALDAQTTELYKFDVLTKSFTNTSKYPFNNSKASVALGYTMENVRYNVTAEVLGFEGNVGEVVITEKLVNGFKAEYTGSAKSATIRFTITGGFNK